MAIRYSEIFGGTGIGTGTIQGEGNYTGVPTVWIRLFGCNFTCAGFGQKNLSDPSSWELPWNNHDFSQYTELSQVPMFNTACDSFYSWHKDLRHLAFNDDVATIADKITNLLVHPQFNKSGSFLHDTSKQETHFAITGGEPMMQQSSIVSILQEFATRDNCPSFITIESNGTRPIKKELIDLILAHKTLKSAGGLHSDSNKNAPEWFWSISPKLSASGEYWEDAIKPDVVKNYSFASNAGQLKFVVDGTLEVWDEVQRAVDLYRSCNVNWPIWIMPEGTSKDRQMEERIAKIAEDTVARGYNFSARVHNYIWSNSVGK